jgi:hypothetical protein
MGHTPMSGSSSTRFSAFRYSGAERLLALSSEAEAVGSRSSKAAARAATSRPWSRRGLGLVLSLLLAAPSAWAKTPSGGQASAAPSAASSAAAVTSVEPAAREPAAGEPSAADRAAAQVLFDEGRTLMEKGRQAEACPRFEQSEKLEPGLGTRFHLANCYEAVGKLASAFALFLEVAAEAEARGQAERERVARSRARAVEPRLARISIEVPYASSPALRVERDGALVGSAQWGLPVPVDAGVHRVDASAPGRVTWHTEVEVREEGSVTRIDVPPLAENRPSFFAPLSRKIGLAALGVGVGTIALGTVFTVQAISKKNASERAGCNDTQCTSENGLALREEALQAGNRATWAMGIGVVGLGAAAALFWVLPVAEEDDSESDVQIEPVADLSSASLRVHGHF